MASTTSSDFPSIVIPDAIPVGSMSSTATKSMVPRLQHSDSNPPSQMPSSNPSPVGWHPSYDSPVDGNAKFDMEVSYQSGLDGRPGGVRRPEFLKDHHNRMNSKDIKSARSGRYGWGLIGSMGTRARGANTVGQPPALGHDSSSGSGTLLDMKNWFSRGVGHASVGGPGFPTSPRGSLLSLPGRHQPSAASVGTGPAAGRRRSSVMSIVSSRSIVFLPRFIRTPRGLFFLVCTFLFTFIYIATKAEEAAIKYEKFHDPDHELRGGGARLGIGIIPAINSLKANFMGGSKDGPAAGANPSAIVNVKGSLATKMAGSKEHIWHSDGHLIVNPRGRHPIIDLIERGESKWRSLVKSQSKTLKECADEYRRRYKKHPPKGFDKWWEFAKKNRIILVDEYDQIHRDLEPFWALEASDMRHRHRVMQERDHTVTIAINPDRASASGEETDEEGMIVTTSQHRKLKRALDMRELMMNFVPSLKGLGMGDINMTYIIDDQPAVMMSWLERDRMLELAARGEHYGPSEFVSSKAVEGLSNYAKACHPTSRLVRAETADLATGHDDFLNKGYQNIPPSGYEGLRSFIYDHGKTSDLCQHPEYRHLHGMTSKTGVGLGPIVPLFTWAKMNLHSDILVTPLEQYSESYIGYDPPWELKSHSKLLWRGSTTGAEFRTNEPWKLSQRARVHFMTHEREGERKIVWTDASGKQQEKTTSAAALNDLYMDTSFSGGPVQCDEETCKVMEKIIKFAPTQGLDDSYQYKYMLDIDGNGWSGRFHRLMSTKSMVLKTTVFPEWYNDRVMPWVHYVPLKVDYSDLYDIMSFFMGNVDGQGAHDAMAERIAENGRLWARDHWRKIDMAAYMFRLTLEFARLMNKDSEDWDYLD